MGLETICETILHRDANKTEIEVAAALEANTLQRTS